VACWGLQSRAITTPLQDYGHLLGTVGRISCYESTRVENLSMLQYFWNNLILWGNCVSTPVAKSNYIFTLGFSTL
jgi:hypothetical protein